MPARPSAAGRSNGGSPLHNHVGAVSCGMRLRLCAEPAVPAPNFGARSWSVVHRLRRRVCINPLIHFHYGYRKQVSEEYRPPESGHRQARSPPRCSISISTSISRTTATSISRKMMKQTSITEMFHTDKIADRILFLQGEVEMMPSFEPRKIRDVKEALEFSMTLEQRTVDSLQRVGASVCCRGRPDHAQAFPGSRQRGRRNISTCSVPRWRTCSTTASNTSPCNRSPTARKLLKITGSGEALLKNGGGCSFSAVSGDNGSKKNVIFDSVSTKNN